MYSKSRNTNKNTSAVNKPGPVTLALQLVSGERLTTEFPPESTLWEILEHWEAENKLDPPLKQLSVCNDIPTCIYMRKEISTEKSLKSTTLFQLEIFNGRAAIRYAAKTEGVVNQAHVGGNIEKTPRPVTPEPAASNNIPPTEPIKVEIRPDDDDSTRIIYADEIKQELEKEIELPISKVAQKEVETSKAVEEMETEISLSHQSSNTKPQQDTCFVDDRDCTVHFLNERGDLIYRRPVDEPVPSTASFSDDPGDSFFELTEDEVRRRMAELVQNSKQLNNAPLMTSQLRKQQEEERRQQLFAKYPTTLLRIQFPDSLILQLPLPTMSTISEVKREVLNYVEDALGPQDIVLFTTPPKQVLENNDLNLLELGLSPSSMIYISGRILKEQYRTINQISSYLSAVRDASHRLFTGTPSDSDEMEVEEIRSKRQASSTGTSTSAANKSSSNVPKWLKLKR